MNPIAPFQVGDLIRFVFAPGRWKGEMPRCPGDEVLGKLAIITAFVPDRSHEWGGRWTVFCDGHTFDHWGDFMEVLR